MHKSDWFFHRRLFFTDLPELIMHLFWKRKPFSVHVFCFQFNPYCFKIPIWLKLLRVIMWCSLRPKQTNCPRFLYRSKCFFFFAESWRVNKGLQLWTQSLKLGTCNRYRTGNTYWIDDYQKFWTIHQSSHFTVLKPYQCNAKTTWALMPWAFTTRLVCSWGVLRVTHSIFTQVHTRNKLQ